MKKIIITTLLALLGGKIFANNVSDEDVLYNVLRQEINYYYSHLSQDSIPVTFLSFNALDEKHLNITSDMGYSTIEEDNTRKFFPTMAFKGYKREDSFIPFSEWYSCSRDLPVDNDTAVIKGVIWNYMRHIYNETTQGIKRKDSVEDNKASIMAEVYYESPLPENDLDIDKWKAMLNRLSENKKKGIPATCKAILIAEKQRQYIVDSYGTAIAQNHTYYWVTLFASVKDDNGTECPLYEQYFAYNESELPDENMLNQTMDRLIERASALSKAPLAEAYSGPVLFSGEAGGLLFHEVLGHRLERENSEFKSMMGKSVLPSELSVTCNPLAKDINGTPVCGYYQYDDEGAKAQKVECIKDGILIDFLHNKPQNKDDALGNGHGRAEFGNLTMPRQSNLFVECNHPYTEQQLREMFIQDLKQCNKEYGYYVHTVSNGNTTRGTDNERASAFNVFPIETYRIYADGRPDQLVRGVSFIGTPLAAFSNIKAAGGKVGVFNGSCGARSGWVPVSAVSPMLYISQMETQCLQESRSRRKTFLSAPEFVPKEKLCGMDTDSVIFRAMEDEMKRCMDSLKAEDGTKPYFMDYVIYRYVDDEIESAHGGHGYGKVNGIKYKGKVNLIIGDKMRVKKDWGVDIEELPDDVSYNHIRRELWLASEFVFKRLLDRSDNGATRDCKFIADSIPEWPHLPAKVIIEKSALDNYESDLEMLKARSDTLAAELKKYPELFDKKIGCDLEYADVYRLTSDGLRTRTSMKDIYLRANAKYLASNGKIFDGGCVDGGYDIDDLQPTDSLITMLEKEVYRMKHQEKPSIMKRTDYVGPVLCEGNSAENELYSTVDNRTNIAHYIHSKLEYKDRTYNTTYQRLGERVVNKNISVWQLGNDSVYNGQRFKNYHKYDADGIQPAKIELIRDGVLVNQLAGREPTPIARKSTGNERLMGPDSRCMTTQYENGLLRISFRKTMSRKHLIKKLTRLARKQNLKFAYIKGANNIRINIKTGEREEIRSHCHIKPSRLQLLGEMWASKENDVDYDNSIIYPKSILFPLVEMNIEPLNSDYCGRFLELKH